MLEDMIVDVGVVVVVRCWLIDTVEREFDY
jgi:hypothetical protein